MTYPKPISRIRVVGAIVGFAASAMVVVSSAQAATQGTLGPTSTGSVTITASVPSRAQITGLTDVSFAGVDPTTAATSAQNDCVWSNTSNKGYSITATGSGSSGAFTLTDSSATLSVPYTVQWAASTGQSSGTALAAGTALTGLTSTAISPTCSGSPTSTSSLIVNMSATALQSMTSSTSYTGTLTLLVTPQ